MKIVGFKFEAPAPEPVDIPMCRRDSIVFTLVYLFHRYVWSIVVSTSAFFDFFHGFSFLECKMFRGPGNE